MEGGGWYGFAPPHHGAVTRLRGPLLLRRLHVLTYIGNAPYCYANSASMLLESAGESIEPRLIEVLSGVGLGAEWMPESQTLFLSGWTVPDTGVSQSFRLLGFKLAEEAESDGAPIPIEGLNLQLREGPVMLGPLDMGELSYHPNARGASGIDHFVLALHAEGDEIVVHDPAGYPAMPIDVEALGRAWRADLIEYRRGAYRRWHSPARVEDPSPGQIAEAAIQSFGQAYRDSRTLDDPSAVVGPEALEALVVTIRGGDLRDSGLEHLRRFALPLGVRRALDYSWYLRELNPELGDLKDRQAWHLARAHSAAARGNWVPLAEHLMHLADLEREFETGLVGEAS